MNSKADRALVSAQNGTEKKEAERQIALPRAYAQARREDIVRERVSFLGVFALHAVGN